MPNPQIRAPRRTYVEPCYATIGSRLRAQRETLALSRERVAKSIKTTRRNLQNAEEGKQRLMLHHVLALCRLFKLRPDDLLKNLW